MSNNDDFDGIDPLDAILEGNDFNPAMPGGPATAISQPEPIPEATPENFVCLRGPCINYMEVTHRFNHGNREMGDEFAPKQYTRYCLKTINPIELTDELVHDCSHWCPMGHKEHAKVEAARNAYRKRAEGKQNNGSK